MIGFALLAALVLGQAEPAPDTSGWTKFQDRGGTIWIDPVIKSRDGARRRFRGSLDSSTPSTLRTFDAVADCDAISLEMVSASLYENGSLKAERKAAPGTHATTEAESRGTEKMVKYVCGL